MCKAKAERETQPPWVLVKASLWWWKFRITIIMIRFCLIMIPQTQSFPNFKIKAFYTSRSQSKKWRWINRIGSICCYNNKMQFKRKRNCCKARALMCLDSIHRLLSSSMRTFCVECAKRLSISRLNVKTRAAASYSAHFAVNVTITNAQAVKMVWWSNHQKSFWRYILSTRSHVTYVARR